MIGATGEVGGRILHRCWERIGKLPLEKVGGRCRLVLWAIRFVVELLVEVLDAGRDFRGGGCKRGDVLSRRDCPARKSGLARALGFPVLFRLVKSPFVISFCFNMESTCLVPESLHS